MRKPKRVSAFFIIAFFSIILFPSLTGATVYTYDSLNRLIRVNYDNGTIVEYGYDAVGNRIQLGTAQGFTITAIQGANGSITPAGQTVISIGGSLTYTITPSTNYYISDVQVDGASVGATANYTFSNMMSNHFITAKFRATHSISGIIETTGSMAIAGETVILDEPNNQTLTTTTDNNGIYNFTGLHDGTYTVAPSSWENYAVATATVTVNGVDITNVNFTITPYSISANAGPGGIIAPSGNTIVANGGSQTYTITPSLGSYIADVKVDGASVGPVDTYTFSDVTADHAISADFELLHSISGIMSTSIGTAISGDLITLNGANNQTWTATTDSNGNYSFTGLHNGTYTVTPGTWENYAVAPAAVIVNGADITNLNFTITPYSISANAGPGGIIAPSGNTIVANGGSQTYTITLSPGYYVNDVQVDGVSVGPVPTYTFSNVTADHVISASFVTYIDVSSQVSATGTGFLYSRLLRLFTGNLTITNNGPNLTGMIDVALSGLPSGITLANATGQYNGAPMIRISTGGLTSGASATVQLKFSDPAMAKITFAPVTLLEYQPSIHPIVQ